MKAESAGSARVRARGQSFATALMALCLACACVSPKKKAEGETAGQRMEYPRSMSENGPPGAVRKRHKDESPTNPTYHQTTPEPGKPEEEQATLVTAGSFPKSFKVPGTTTSIGIGGFVRADVLYSLDPIGNDRQFDTSTIPVPQESGTSTNLDFSWSRLQIESHSETGVGDVKGLVQADFFGQNETIRLRWAYVDVGPIRAGLAASSFMDYDMWPNVIDPDGPNAMLLKRHTIVQMTFPLKDESFKAALAIEDPDSDITLPTDSTGQTVGDAVNELPDLTGHVRYDWHTGHAQLSGLVRRLTYDPLTGSDTSATGYGVHVSADVNPWALAAGRDAAVRHPTPKDKSRLLGQLAVGEGFSSYLESVAPGLDGAVNASGNLEALPITTWTLGYEHWWAQHWTSTLSYGQFDIDGIDTMPGDSQKQSKFFAVNLIWVSARDLWVGVEFLHGERGDLDGQSADADRIMFGIQYNF